LKGAHGHVLQDGNTVTLIKDLKIKGSSSVVKVGTKVSSIGQLHTLRYQYCFELHQ